MVSKKWINLERNTLHRHSVGPLGRLEASGYRACQFLRSG